MRRPLVWMAAPVCFYCIFGAVLHISFFILFITSVIAFAVIFKILKSEYLKKYILFLAAFSAFALIIIGINSKNSSFINDLPAEGISVNVRGHVKKIITYDDYMNVLLSKAKLKDKGKTNNIRGVIVRAPISDLSLGDTVSVEGKLLPLERARNEGNFDAKNYYESIGVFSSLKADKEINIIKKGNIYMRVIDGIRRHFLLSFEAVSPKHKGELASVVAGDKSMLEAEIKDLYTDNGIAHLLAISGLHISFAGLGVYRLLRKAGRGLYLSVSLSGFFVIGYCILTGGSVSAWRACVMFLFAAAADVAGRSYDPLSALSLQAVITLFNNPKAITGASFIMSYTAVLSIIIANEAFGNVLYRLKGDLTVLRIILSDIITSTFIFVFMLPVNLYFYHSIPTYSVLLNMIVIPLSGIIMPLGAAAGILGLFMTRAGIFFAGGAERIFEFYAFLCRAFSGLPYNTITPGKPAAFMIFIFYAAFIWAFILWKFNMERELKTLLGEPFTDIKRIFTFFKHKVNVMAVGSIPLLITFTIILKPPRNDFYVAMIDVGQGDSIFVHTAQGKNLLFDGGSSNVKNVYKNRIKSFFKSRGISTIDMVLVSHTDADHVNGLLQMLEECDGPDGNKGSIRVKGIILPDVSDEMKDDFFKSITQTAREKNIYTAYASEGLNIKDNDFELTALSPAPDDYSGDKNELSAVYSFKTGDFSMLFTGDMTEASERKLLAKNVNLKAEVLKTAHHGSNYSSSSEFLSAVSPKLCMISCAEKNRYGHPGRETLERIKQIGAEVLVTKDRGQIFIEKKRGDYVVRTYL